MYPLGLSTAEWAAYIGALSSSHSIRIGVDVLTTDHQLVSSLDQRILGGQVNGDEFAEVTRSATLQLFDPQHALNFDSDSPSDGALYADRMIRITYGVRPPAGAWVDVPLITGPITKFTRDAAVVDVEVQGKELLSMGAAWRTQTYKKRTPKRDVILSVLKAEGERFFSFPEFSARLPADKSITRESTGWEFAKALTASTGRKLYYDGWGRCRISTVSTRTAFTFATGNGGTILSSPKVTFSTDNVKNVVWVKGAKPKGAKAKVTWAEVAPRAHPLSPWRLGRNGQPRYLLETIEDSSIRSEAEAKAVARARLKVLLLQNVDVTFESLVVPHLELGDHITTKTDDFSVPSRFSTFSIPLTANGSMSVGYMQRKKIARNRIR